MTLRTVKTEPDFADGETRIRRVEETITVSYLDFSTGEWVEVGEGELIPEACRWRE